MTERVKLKNTIKIYVSVFNLLPQAGASVSNLFSGMSVSGQPPSSSAPPTSVVRPAHTHGKKTSPRLAEKGRRGGKREEEASHFGDLLGLSSTEEAPPPVSQHLCLCIKFYVLYSLSSPSIYTCSIIIAA